MKADNILIIVRKKDKYVYCKNLRYKKIEK